MEWVLRIFNAVNLNRTLFKLIESGDQLYKRGFAAAGIADKGNLAASRDMQSDAFEYCSIFRIAEEYFFKGNITF